MTKLNTRTSVLRERSFTSLTLKSTRPEFLLIKSTRFDIDAMVSCVAAYMF